MFAALVCALLFVACSVQKASTGSAALRQAQGDTGQQASTSSAALRQAQGDTGVIPVVTTFSTLNSFVEAVGGSHVQVQNLVPIGASPETYQPTPQDVATLSGARLVVENGAGIEAWLQHTIQNAGSASSHVLVLSNGMPVVGNNPHLWMDPVYAREYVRKIHDALIAIDPKDKADYDRNTSAYLIQLLALQNYVAREIQTIPAQQRAMIIFHNAFDYYNRRFGIQTVGIIELSPGQDPNPEYIGHLVDLARAHHVRAVFSEPEYSPKLAETLAHSAGIHVVTNLYDDSIGEDPRVNNYVNMIRYDTGVIVQSLE
jgi:manganese/iron transport system substrate-binding protein